MEFQEVFIFSNKAPTQNILLDKVRNFEKLVNANLTIVI